MTYQSTNPATGAVEQTFDEITDSDLEATVARAQVCYERDWRDRQPKARAAVVAWVAAKLRDNVDELAGYVTAEMGKLIAQAKAEVMLSADILDYYAQRVEAYQTPQELSEAPGHFVETRPLGVILAIEPWNFPYYQLARVVGPQVAVGNVVIAKHANNVPQCARAFARMFEEAGAPEGVYTNIFASRDQLNRLIEDNRVRGVTVTGSEGAGAAVAERAGRNLKKSVMELGGSDPMVVLDDAPFAETLACAVWGRMNNTGQSCVATKRLIVVGKERGKQFLDGLVEQFSALKPGDPADAATTLGPLSSEDAAKGLVEQIGKARDAGAMVALGGNRIDRPGFYVEATILTDIAPDNPVYTQELFGPALSFYVVDDEDAAVALANATPFGRGASVFSADTDRARRVAERIDSGMVFINNPTWTAPELPFGGVKNSGYGRELSELGFGEFVNRKLISIAQPGSPPPGASGGG